MEFSTVSDYMESKTTQIQILNDCVCVGMCGCAGVGGWVHMHTSGPSTHSSGTVVLVAIATAGNSCLGKRSYSQCRTVIMMKAIPDCYKLHYTEQMLSYQEHNNNDIVRVGNLIVT